MNDPPTEGELTRSPDRREFCLAHCETTRRVTARGRSPPPALRRVAVPGGRRRAAAVRWFGPEPCGPQRPTPSRWHPRASETTLLVRAFRHGSATLRLRQTHASRSTPRSRCKGTGRAASASEILTWSRGRLLIAKRMRLVWVAWSIRYAARSHSACPGRAHEASDRSRGPARG